MAVLVSYEGTCTVGFTIDPAAVADSDLLLGCTLEAFSELGVHASRPGEPGMTRAHAPSGLKRTGASGTPQPWAAVAVAVLAFFIVTLDAVVVNVALPSIQDDLGGGVQGLQWVVDGYTLMFAAFLLTAGSLSDRVGARQAIGYGIALFVVTSVGCGLAPSLEPAGGGSLVAGRGRGDHDAGVVGPDQPCIRRSSSPRASGRSLGHGRGRRCQLGTCHRWTVDPCRLAPGLSDQRARGRGGSGPAAAGCAVATSACPFRRGGPADSGACHGRVDVWRHRSRRCGLSLTPGTARPSVWLLSGPSRSW